MLYGTIISELTSRNYQKYQVRFEEIENVIVDILANKKKDKNNEDVIELSTTINWQEQPVIIDQYAINLVYNYKCKTDISLQLV
ncbi:18487_t:CDS:2 [Gigaspora margarita]|uniref:18487_t:CDS:1 n=1 Tax=Gigaspora margarita TaxID=4874 RepID=A0ABN7ULN0_GIGMA|nr:18487_t:CDS:2 [Gigaspora margarita]